MITRRGSKVIHHAPPTAARPSCIILYQQTFSQLVHCTSLTIKKSLNALKHEIFGALPEAQNLWCIAYTGILC